MLKSGKLRFVVRRSSNNITCQIISHDSKGDKTMVNTNSTDIKKLGWNGHLGNLTSAYLIGLLCGVRAKSQNIKEAVLDLGLQTSIKGSKLYSALKGALDAGINISHSEKIFPSEERISGEHIAKYASDLKAEKPEEYRKRFSIYLKKKQIPEELPKHFSEIKERILSSKTATKTAKPKQTKTKKTEAKKKE